MTEQLPYTTVYLDVDGVINAFNGSNVTPNDGYAGWNQWDVRKAHGFTIRFSHELLRRLEALGSRQNVQIKWLTTWRNIAQSELCPVLELAGSDWPVVPDANVFSQDWWKFLSLELDWDGNTQIIWIDDDIDIYRPVIDNWRSSLVKPNLLHTFCPSTGAGITRSMMEEIEALV